MEPFDGARELDNVARKAMHIDSSAVVLAMHMHEDLRSFLSL